MSRPAHHRSGARTHPAAGPVVALVLVALCLAVVVTVLGGGAGGADLMPHGDAASRAALEAAGLRP